MTWPQVVYSIAVVCCSLAFAPAAFAQSVADEAKAENDRGLRFQAQGDFAQAEACFRRSLKLYEQALSTKNHPWIAAVLVNLAILHRQTGKYPEAEELYERSVTILAAHPDQAVLLADVEYNRAELLRRLGRLATAQEMLERLRKTFREQKRPLKEASTLASLGGLYLSRKCFADAQRCSEGSLLLYRRELGEQAPEVATAENNHGWLFTRLDPPRLEEAGVHFRKALAILEGQPAGRLNPLAVAQAQTNWGWVLHLQGKHADALTLYRQGFATRRERLEAHNPDAPELVFSRSNLALLAGAMGRWDNALAEMHQARQSANRHLRRTVAQAPELDQLDYLREHQEQTQQALSIGLARRTDDAAVARSAEWALNSKGISLEILAERLARGRGRAAARRGGAARDGWVELAAVRAALPADGVLVEFARFDPWNFAAPGTRQPGQAMRYAAWVIPPAGQGAVRLVDLGDAAPIDRAVAAVQQAMAAAPDEIERNAAAAEQRARTLLNDLSRGVLHPLAQELTRADVRSWLFSPDGDLWLVPWAALPLADGRPVVDRYPVRLVASGRELFTPAGAAAADRALVVADPDYLAPPDPARADARGLALHRRTQEALLGKRFPRLPGTAQEADEIEPILAKLTGRPVEVLTRAAATEKRIKNLSDYRYVVLCTHGFALPADPARPGEDPRLLCGLALAGADRRQQAVAAGLEDGVLTGYEILGMDFQGTRLVVLSACESALGEVRTGEAVAGLNLSFRLAGARSVVSALWPIPDNYTPILMGDLFRELGHGREDGDPAVALQRAQQRLRDWYQQEQSGGRPAHPFIWAAFTVTGVPR